MIKHDSEMLWKPGRVFVPQSEMSGWLGTTATDVGQGAGAPIQKEISTFGIVGAFFDTADDELGHFMQIPYDLDPAQSVYFRAHFTTGSATAADTITWKVLYRALTPNVTAIIDPTVALSTAIAQQTLFGTAYTYEVSPWGILNPGLITEKTEALVVKVAMAEFAGGLTEDKFFLGFEMRYTPKRLMGPNGMGHPAKPALSLLGKAY